MRRSQPQAARQRRGIASIDQEARAKAGEAVSRDAIREEERRKAEEFKARRAARQGGADLADSDQPAPPNRDASVESTPPDESGSA